MSSLRGMGVVLRKEVKDHLRDRRSLASALLMPLLGPVLFTVMFSLIASWSRQDRVVEVPMAGRDHAPGLVAFLERNGARVTLAPEDYEGGVRDGQLDLVLVVPAGYAEDFRKGRPARIELMADTSSNRSRPALVRVQALLQAYGQQLAALRLLARGVSPELATPLAVQHVEIATAEKQAAKVLGMVPLFLLMAVFMGGMHLAIDATAGERERGSLEPLLLNPVTRLSIVAGKWLATVGVSWVAVLVTLGAFVVALERVPLEDLGLRARLGATEIAGLLVVTLPLTLFAAGLQMLVATFARTFKEAQTYISLLFVVPMMPAMFIGIYPIQSRPWMMLVPTLGQTLLVNDLMRGEWASTAWVALAAAGAVAAAAVCLGITVRMLGNERIVFGR
jgi:sodium transport system permease protein